MLRAMAHPIAPASTRNARWPRLPGATLLTLSLLSTSCTSPLPLDGAAPLVDLSPPAGADAGALPPIKPEAWLADSIGYEIFVRSFADSNSDGQGDLPGIIQRLPYLAELGVNLLWLTPIHPSPSYHGYDVADYDGIHKDFGTQADLDRLVAAAHAQKMRLVLDLVANHTSQTHPWFTAALAAPTGSAAASRYLFRGNDPGWKWNGNSVFRPVSGQAGRYYYGLFSGVMPDLNFRDEGTVQELQQMMTRWLSRGIDGFRLDAARYLVEWPEPTTATSQPALSDTADTHQAWKRLRAATSAAAPSSALIGEVWSDPDNLARYHGSGDELHSAFAFPLAGAMVDAVRRGSARPVADTLTSMLRGAAPLRYFAPFLTNHDQKRLATELGQDAASLRLAASLLLVMPGTPFLYYGEEVGVAQSTDAGDRGQRSPMPWTTAVAQQSQAGSLWQHYQLLIKARRSLPALRTEATRLLPLVTADDRLLTVLRGEPKRPDAVVAIYNLSQSTVSGAQLQLPADFAAGSLRDLWSTATLAAVTRDNRDRYPLPALPPRSAMWLVRQ
jgi:alpha-amylase